jgi:hypothetical protein
LLVVEAPYQSHSLHSPIDPSVRTRADEWTKDEDEALREAAIRHGPETNWAAVLKAMECYGRSAGDIGERYLIVKMSTIKGPWTREEDVLLGRLVKENGPKKWSKIAESIPGRRGKQCRERWLNHLDSKVKKTAWTPDEDAILLGAQERLGNKWSEIAKLLSGRAENAVKNRYNSLINRRWTEKMKNTTDEETRQEFYRQVLSPLFLPVLPSYIAFQSFLPALTSFLQPFLPAILSPVSCVSCLRVPSFHYAFLSMFIGGDGAGAIRDRPSSSHYPAVPRAPIVGRHDGGPYPQIEIGKNGR